MTRTKKHAPTPWKLINEKTIVGTDHPRQGYVADVNLHRSNDEQQPDGDTNAAHIVRCVNNHESLLNALKSLVKEIDLSKLNIRKDFSLLNAHAFATKTIHQAEGK